MRNARKNPPPPARSGENKMRPLRDIVRDFLFERAAAPDYENAPVTEVEIAQRLRLSRTPARKALIELEREGLITRRKKKGIFLRRPALKEIAEIYDVRSVFEGFAARIAAEKIDAQYLEQLDVLLEKLRQGFASKDILICAEADMEFHGIIIALADNSILSELAERLNVLERSFFLFQDPRNMPSDDNPYSHKAILEALRGRKPDDAEQLVRQHIQWAKKRIVEEALEIKLDRF